MCTANRLLAESLATALAHRGWTIEAVGATCSDALTAVSLYGPDICLLSSALPDGSAMDAAEEIVTTSRTRVVVMSTALDRPTLMQARASGVAAVVGEDRPVDAIHDVLSRVTTGETVMDLATVIPLRAVGRAQPTGTAGHLPDVLTSREHEVLARMASGESTTEMAKAMDVSTATVRSHIQRILGKFGVHTRLMAVAMYGGVVEPGDATASPASALRAV